MKGGAAGGGHAQVVPMDELNLHFTGDFHAIGVANNLLAALVDNHVYWGNSLDIDARRITWRRCLDMNDRALRSIVSSLGGIANGFPREDGFDITVASEVMAILCLSTSLQDLERRLSNIIVASTRGRTPVRARDLRAQGAMTAVLRDAIKPNLVQTLENNPVFVHGGPFANIAHGCNSVLATKLGLKLADYVVTEAGFGADLGAEKFFDIKCRKAGLSPALAVVVVTVRALKFHGGVARKDLGGENVAAVVKGLANLERHLENIRKFGVPAVVALNHFASDSRPELDAVVEGCRKLGARAVVCRHWAEGSAGTADLADAVLAAIEEDKANFHTLYPDSMRPLQKIETIAYQIYHAGDVVPSKQAADRLEELERLGFGHLPICIAKTQYSYSADPEAYGAPTGHVLPLREVRLCAGAEFIVAICGDIMTMPGLPRQPSAEAISVNERGQIIGLS
jgi:formate--tetrahydrofolate ligase